MADHPVFALQKHDESDAVFVPKAIMAIAMVSD